MLFLFLFFLPSVFSEDPVSYNHPFEAHHCLHKPLDQSQVYWNYGGATVVTRSMIRLTPSTQDRKGWLWNEYPIEAENWELEFVCRVHSKFHFGGDGFGLWVVSAFQRDSAGLFDVTGPVMGMRNDFKGFGVIFDIYDNDNKRNNPAIFVLENLEGGQVKFNHDDDFASDMVQRVPPSTGPDSANKYNAHRCVADIRNNGRENRVLVKFLHKVLHVYVDVMDGSGYKFCLAVPFDQHFVDYHFAFTAATGQVADNIDILEINTRYLAATDKDTDDSLLAHYSSTGSASTLQQIGTLAIFVTGLFNFFVAAYSLLTFYQNSHIDEVIRVKNLNSFLNTHLIGHVTITLLLLINAQWMLLIVNIPLLAWRVWSFYTNSYVFAIREFKTGYGLNKMLSTTPRLVLDLAFYSVTLLLYLRLLLA